MANHAIRIAELCESFRPAPDALLDVLRPQVDDSMLREIAEADYGRDADEHFAALREIHRGIIPNPIQWHPREVLQLFRWSEPEDPGWKPGATGIQGHWMRAFACAVLLRSAGEPLAHMYFENEHETLMQLIDSSLVLGTDVIDAARSCLAWRIPLLESYDTAGCFFGLGILLLSMVQKPGSGTDPANLLRLAEWIVGEEARVRKECCPESEDWLLGLTCHDQEHDKWCKLVHGILGDVRSTASAKLGPAIQGIVSRLPERYIVE